jgi:CBS domain containing-hemolysin-like protein
VIWILAVAAVILTLFGATAHAALVAWSRSVLADVVARRLRGGQDSLAWLAPLERNLSAASVTTTLGIVTLGTVFPAMFAGASLAEFGLLLIGVAIPFVLLSGSVLPRLLTHEHAARVADLVQPILTPWSALLSAFLPTAAARPEAEITSLWRERAGRGMSPDDELLRVGGVITFSQRTVREVMTPRTELVAIPEEASAEEVRAAFVQSGFTRLPVYRGTMDEIVGMVHAFDLFRLGPGDPLPIRPLAVTPGSRTCADALLDMQRERRHLAVVLDEFGGTLGIVTLEDLLEAMVGEIVDEDAGAPARPAGEGPGLLEVDGATPVAQIEAQFGVELPAGQASTLGGRLVELAGRFPLSGERFLVRGLEVDVVHASATRVERVLVRRASPVSIPLDRASP